MATALQRTKLMNPAYVASSVGSIYANPAVTKSFIRGFIIYNANSIAESVNLHMVPNASGSLGTADATNRFLKRAVQPDETVFVELPYCITLTGTNDAIFASTGTASKVTIIAVGDIEA